MTRAEIIETQRRMGTTPDGFWGPKSIAACQAHLRALMPKPNPWPDQSDVAMTRFYGKAGDQSNLVLRKVPCSIKVKYVGKEIGKPGCQDDVIRCHRLVADSLMRVLMEIGKTHPSILLQYYGCFSFRAMRGGSRPSKHAWGAAIDLDAARNGNKVSWPVKASMPLEVMECFAREGWLPAGAFWGRDAMHFQATK